MDDDVVNWWGIHLFHEGTSSHWQLLSHSLSQSNATPTSLSFFPPRFQPPQRRQIDTYISVFPRRIFVFLLISHAKFVGMPRDVASKRGGGKPWRGRGGNRGGRRNRDLLADSGQSNGTGKKDMDGKLTRLDA